MTLFKISLVCILISLNCFQLCKSVEQIEIAFNELLKQISHAKSPQVIDQVTNAIAEKFEVTADELTSIKEQLNLLQSKDSSWNEDDKELFLDLFYGLNQRSRLIELQELDDKTPYQPKEPIDELFLNLSQIEFPIVFLTTTMEIEERGADGVILSVAKLFSYPPELLKARIALMERARRLVEREQPLEDFELNFFNETHRRAKPLFIYSDKYKRTFEFIGNEQVKAYAKMCSSVYMENKLLDEWIQFIDHTKSYRRKDPIRFNEITDNIIERLGVRHGVAIEGSRLYVQFRGYDKLHKGCQSLISNPMAERCGRLTRFIFGPSFATKLPMMNFEHFEIIDNMVHICDDIIQGTIPELQLKRDSDDKKYGKEVETYIERQRLALMPKPSTKESGSDDDFHIPARPFFIGESSNGNIKKMTEAEKHAELLIESFSPQDSMENFDNRDFLTLDDIPSEQAPTSSSSVSYVSTDEE